MNPILVFLHGLNNTSESFYFLGDSFKKQGWDVRYFSLYGHNNHLEETISMNDSVNYIHKQIDSLNNQPYIFVGFSQGALDFQVAIQTHSHKPVKQILLAPALKVQNENVLKRALKFVPSSLKIQTTTPLETRMYSKIYPSYYKTIFEKIDQLNQIPTNDLNDIPTVIYVDPKDELIDVNGLLSFIGIKQLNWF